MPKIILPIVIANPVDNGDSIENIDTIHELLQYLSNHQGVDAGPILNQIESIPFKISNKESSDGGASNTVQFIKGDPSYILYDNNKFYPYPPNTAFLYVGDDYPGYLTKLTDEEITDYGLTKPGINSGAIWLIFKP